MKLSKDGGFLMPFIKYDEFFYHGECLFWNLYCLFFFTNSFVLKHIWNLKKVSI